MKAWVSNYDIEIISQHISSLSVSSALGFTLNEWKDLISQARSMAGRSNRIEIKNTSFSLERFKMLAHVAPIWSEQEPNLQAQLLNPTSLELAKAAYHSMI